ncbi:MAG: helix-turn-helix domain-containing protein [Euryarchaeota archaeon]|nr:helix-turn-helix domain-containing protein [Euryarchaeota archaeon]
MAQDEAVLDLDSRRRIYGHIEKNPGLHLRALQRALDMPLGTLEYHLYQLDRAGMVVIREDGRYKAFFPKGGDLDRRDKDILYYVRQEVPRRIVMTLLIEPGASHGDLVKQLPVSASTVSFHVKKLVKAGIVGEVRAGRGKHFRVVDPDRVAKVLVRYRKSFLDDLVDRFARVWMDMSGMPAEEDEEGTEEPGVETTSEATDAPGEDEKSEGKEGTGTGPVSLASRLWAALSAAFAIASFA